MANYFQVDVHNAGDSLALLFEQAFRLSIREIALRSELYFNIASIPHYRPNYSPLFYCNSINLGREKAFFKIDL